MFKRIALSALLAFSISGGATAQTYFQLNLGSALPTEKTDVRDPAAVIGASAGFDFGTVRVEGEYLRLDTGSNGGGRLGQVSSDVVFLNAYVEPFNLGPVTPYVGAGVGYAWSSGGGIRGTGDGLVYNVGGGLTYALNKAWALNAGYRYLISDEVEVRPNVGRSEGLRSHLLTVGVRYSF